MLATVAHIVWWPVKDSDGTKKKRTKEKKPGELSSRYSNFLFPIDTNVDVIHTQSVNICTYIYGAHYLPISSQKPTSKE